MGLVLSVVGLYGVMSYIVRARTQEIGIRMALGAQRTNVLHLILRQGVAQIAGGVVLGVGVALYVSNGMSRLVFQMSPWDPVGVGIELRHTCGDGFHDHAGARAASHMCRSVGGVASGIGQDIVRAVLAVAARWSTTHGSRAR